LFIPKNIPLAGKGDKVLASFEKSYSPSFYQRGKMDGATSLSPLIIGLKNFQALA